MSARHVLLVEDKLGNVTAVGPFPSVDAARTWQDEHGLEAVGCVQLVGRRQGLEVAL